MPSPASALIVHQFRVTIERRPDQSIAWTGGGVASGTEKLSDSSAWLSPVGRPW